MVAADFGIVKSCSTRELSVFEEEGRWGKGLRRERQEGTKEVSGMGFKFGIF